MNTMASTLARHAFGTLKRTSIRRVSLASTRSIHSTVPVLKKKANIDVDDLFGDDFIAEQPIKVSSSTTSGKLALQPSTSAEEKTASSQSGKKALDLAERANMFRNRFDYIAARIGRNRNPTMKRETIRKHALISLLELATSKEELLEISNLIPKIKAGGGELSDNFPEAFVRRCQELDYGDLALKIFGNYAMYDIKLDLPAAQWLVRSLYEKHPFKDIVLATNLYPVYGLPPVSDDLVTASMLAAACYKDNTRPSLKLARSLHPRINAMLDEANLTLAPNINVAKKNRWIALALTRINKAQKSGEPYVPPERLPLQLRRINRSRKHRLARSASSPQP